MDWYRQAKLIDKDFDTEDSQTFIRCMDCKRFLTNMSGEPGEEAVWKDESQMDVDEKENMELALSSWMSEGKNYTLPIGITDTFCPDCIDRPMREYEEYKKLRE